MMRLIKKWFAAIFLGTLAGVAVGDSARGQTWQPTRQADDASTSVDWEQKVLKRPQQLQWQPVQGSANSTSSSTGRTVAVGYSEPVATTPQTTSPHRMARRQSNVDTVFDTGAVPKEPVVTSQPRATVVSGEQMDGPGATQFEPLSSDGAFAGSGGCAHCGGSAGCGEVCGGDCNSSGPVCDDCDFGYEVFDGRCGGWIRNLTLAGGVQGFKGPLDRGVNGNFGFNEGVGIAGPLGDPWNFGYQIGANFLQSDVTRSDETVTLPDRETFHTENRHQSFVTAGIFRRALCGGWQGGVAYDYYHDDYYVQYDLQQIRSEIGYVFPDCCEIGYYGAYGVSSARPTGIDGKLSPTDMFTLYLRHYFQRGNEGRIWGGATGNGDGLLGADMWVPITRSLALNTQATFLIPNSTPTSVRNNSRQERESWGLMVQLVWYPGHKVLCQQRNQYRPLFNVADNSLFMVDRLTK